MDLYEDTPAAAEHAEARYAEDWPEDGRPDATELALEQDRWTGPPEVWPRCGDGADASGRRRGCGEVIYPRRTRMVGDGATWHADCRRRDQGLEPLARLPFPPVPR